MALIQINGLLTRAAMLVVLGIPAMQDPVLCASEMSNPQELSASKAIQTDPPKQAYGTVNEFVYQYTKDSLNGHWKAHAQSIADTVLTESYRYSLDPIFVLAVIRNESQFSPAARGSHGEIGLMQIRPETAKWIVKKARLQIKVRDLAKPDTNIQIGVTYLAFLKERFQSERVLYLAAYNMGTTNVNRALKRKRRPTTYAGKTFEAYNEINERLLNYQLAGRD